MSQIRREEYVRSSPDAVRDEHVEVVRDPAAERRMAVYRLQQLLYTILTLIEGLLIIRFALRLLAANPSAGFSSLIYSITDWLVAPFFGLFPTPAARNGSVIELYTIVALIVYPLIFWVIGRLIRLAFQDNRTELVSRRVDTHVNQPAVTEERVTRRVEDYEVPPPPPPPVDQV